MKVNIGPYSRDLIPVYRWARNYEYWRRPDTCYLPEEEYTRFDKLVFAFLDKLLDVARPINMWGHRRQRKMKIYIDDYDVWDASHTLANVIYPTLLKLKEIQHGSPSVDLGDVPEELRPKTKIESHEVDDLHHQRWAYILDEMIWSFSQHAADDDEAQFRHNSDQLEMIRKPTDNKPYSIGFNYQKDPTKPKYWVDYEGMKKHAERKQNGLRLFAKYYLALWD